VHELRLFEMRVTAPRAARGGLLEDSDLG